MVVVYYRLYGCQLDVGKGLTLLYLSQVTLGHTSPFLKQCKKIKNVKVCFKTLMVSEETLRPP